MPSLCSSPPMERPGVSFFDQKRGEFFSINFYEDGEQVGKAGVADPHLLAVQQVMLAVLRECGAGTDVHCVRAGSCLRERVGANTISRG